MHLVRRKISMVNTLKTKGYEYLISKGHHLVKIEDKVFLIDTGSPISFAVDGSFKSIKINENDYEMNNNIVKVDGNALNEFIGVNIDGLIGVDIVSKIGGVFFDKQEKTISFTSGNDLRNSVRVPIKLFGAMGMYYIDFKFTAGRNNIKALLDTGAYMSYIDPEIAIFGDPDGNAVDYSPTFGGWIETTKVKQPVTIGSENQEISMAIMTRAIKAQLSLLGYKAILGVNEIQWDKMLIDIENNEWVYGKSL
jgi:hypothetical protein